MPSNIFLSEVEEGMCMVREIFDEPSVEIYKSNNGLDFPFVLGLRPLRNSGHFYRIHLHHPLQDDYSEILYPSTLEFTSLQLEA